MQRRSVLLIIALFFGMLAGCSGGGATSSAESPRQSANADAVISWIPNREAAVNQPGGGYRVYHSTAPGFPLSSVTPIDLPYAAGVLPTSTTLRLASGTHYIKLVAYSVLNPTGSEPAEYTVSVPFR